jgi:hypothetical protein
MRFHALKGDTQSFRDILGRFHLVYQPWICWIPQDCDARNAENDFPQNLQPLPNVFGGDDRLTRDASTGPPKARHEAWCALSHDHVHLALNQIGSQVVERRGMSSDPRGSVAMFWPST